MSIVKHGLQAGNWTKLGLISSSAPDLYQLSLTNDKENLIGSVVEGFIIWPLGPNGISTLTKLNLPTEFRNVISRPAGSNSCIINKEKDKAIAGVREYMFIWDVHSETLIKYFKAHYGRIIHMSSLTEGDWNCAVSSSMDRTIKVWSMSNIVEQVYHIQKHENQIEKLEVGESAGLAVSMTRSNVGIWNLKTGELTTNISKVAVSESDKLYIWSLTNRAVVSATEEPGIEQMFFNSMDLRIITARPLENQVYISCREVSTLNLIYDIQTYIKKFRQVCVTPDNYYLVLLGYDDTARKEQLSIYHLYKGTYLFRIQLRYPQLRDVYRLVGFNQFHVALIDSEKANLINLREKKFSRSILKWSGEKTKDQNYGLGAPARGGLYLIDLKSGNISATYIEQVNEGVFRRNAGFTENEEYVWYYHSGRKTIRLFRTLEGVMISNLCIAGDILAIASTSWSLLAGGVDGSLSMYCIADPRIQEKRNLLFNLPSRTGDLDTSQLMLRRNPLVRFRVAARVSILLLRRLERLRQRRPKSENDICSIS
ncbi:uncharacterized protein LOC111703745 [Eurytemora carolleeae]|uniref:uncharacterized protein LOC111703745 n=1 Tax=Eurytemora carolleeae TaxID=1294199 RepID=UPI000C768B7E|nr:uncharacterized protein LOC111703745 [Eurytemora carolleeae]|eukprot:XP_023331551.1 uncharacterized protein LOC111703745 [Eurytemora affinis]